MLLHTFEHNFNWFQIHKDFCGTPDNFLWLFKYLNPWILDLKSIEKAAKSMQWNNYGVKLIGIWLFVKFQIF